MPNRKTKMLYKLSEVFSFVAAHGGVADINDGDAGFGYMRNEGHSIVNLVDGARLHMHVSNEPDYSDLTPGEGWNVTFEGEVSDG